METYVKANISSMVNIKNVRITNFTVFETRSDSCPYHF